MDQPEREACRCGCGELAAPGRQWKRGHASRGEGGYSGSAMSPLPGPGAFAEDAGIIDVDADVPGGSPASGDLRPGGAPGPAAEHPISPAAGLPPPAPDEPPLHATRNWHNKSGGKQSKGRPPKITGAVRADIDAKISLFLEVPGRVWQARDPLCGGVFVAQRPEISASLTSIVCQSADLVAWFTGTGGNFMLALDLMASLWPVVTCAMAHHVYHTIDAEDEDQAAAAEARYAA